MRWTPRGTLLLNFMVIGLVAVPNGAEGQTRVTMSGGLAEYDLSGTGWSGMAGLHVERSALPWLRVEAGSGLFWYETQGNEKVTMLLPEVGVAIQLAGPLPVYFRSGIGRSLVVAGEQFDETTLYGALGLSFAANERWRVRPEVNVRIVDPFVGGIGGFTVGLTRSFGS